MSHDALFGLSQRVVTSTLPSRNRTWRPGLQHVPGPASACGSSAALATHGWWCGAFRSTLKASTHTVLVYLWLLKTNTYIIWGELQICSPQPPILCYPLKQKVHRTTHPGLSVSGGKPLYTALNISLSPSELVRIKQAPKWESSTDKVGRSWTLMSCQEAGEKRTPERKRLSRSAVNQTTTEAVSTKGLHYMLHSFLLKYHTSSTLTLYAGSFRLHYPYFVDGLITHLDLVNIPVPMSLVHLNPY